MAKTKKPSKAVKIENFLDGDVAVSVMNAARANGRTVEEEVNHRLRHLLGGAEKVKSQLRHIG